MIEAHNLSHSADICCPVACRSIKMVKLMFWTQGNFIFKATSSMSWIGTTLDLRWLDGKPMMKLSGRRAAKLKLRWITALIGDIKVRVVTGFNFHNRHHNWVGILIRYSESLYPFNFGLPSSNASNKIGYRRHWHNFLFQILLQVLLFVILFWLKQLITLVIILLCPKQGLPLLLFGDSLFWFTHSQDTISWKWSPICHPYSMEYLLIWVFIGVYLPSLGFFMWPKALFR